MSALTEIEARFKAPDHVTVLNFTWQGRKHVVTSHGRQWQADDGRHLLVMTAGERVFELVYEAQNGTWRLERSPDTGREAA